jgi:hypothetical protein
VYVLIRPFVYLCLLKATPQDLPASTPLLLICLGAALLVTALTTLPIFSLHLSIVQAMVELALLMGYTRIALQLSGHPARFVQTVTALAGAAAVIGILALPLVYSLFRSASNADANPLVLFAYLLVFAWQLVVYGHVYRHALSTSIVAGVLLAFGYVILASLAIQGLFPLSAAS